MRDHGRSLHNLAMQGLETFFAQLEDDAVRLGLSEEDIRAVMVDLNLFTLWSEWNGDL